ncbi:MAG: hypothetical protein QXW80_04565 [Candidatus Micrarchaeia archaeon]
MRKLEIYNGKIVISGDEVGGFLKRILKLIGVSVMAVIPNMYMKEVGLM